MVHSPSNFSVKFIICTILLSLQSLYSTAQIDNVVVTLPTAGYFCTGDNFDIKFTITNQGGNTANYFTANSQYKLEIGTLSGKTFIPVGVITPGVTSNATIPIKGETLPISFPTDLTNTTVSISIPKIASNIAYVIYVTSTNPSDASNKGYSNTFEVVENPLTNAGNDGPYCDTATINLSSNSTAILNTTDNVTYLWEGPNGFTSTLANPVIAGSDPTMSGTYTVTTTNASTSGNICSFISSTNVVVSNDITWTGNTSNDWNDATNWSCGFLPKSTSNVIVPSGLVTYPTITSGNLGICNNITIQPNASLTISNSVLEIKGSIISPNSIDAQNGTINFTGTSTQTITSNSFLNNQIENLSINNSAGVSNLGILNISRILLVNSGTFDTGNFITLLSSAAQTALIDGSGTGTITGNVTMQRFLNPAFGYKLFSAPLQGVIVDDFSSVVDLTASFETFYAYDESREISPGVGATGYIPYVDPAGVLGVFEGYAVNFGGSNVAKTLEVTGTVTSGPQSISLSNNNGTYTKGFNLVGNPYPSPIDWAAGGWTKTNVDNALYFFTTSGTDQYTGVYTSAVNGAGGPSIIPSMQGFFVHVSNSQTGLLAATNAVRVNDFSNEFVKSRNEQKEILKLSAKFDDSNLKDPLLFYFDHGATKGFDSRLDALKLMNTDPKAPNFYCIGINEKSMSINAIPMISGNTETLIPLGIFSATDSWVTISLDDLPNDLTSNYIYLIDEEVNKAINLGQKSSYRYYTKAGKNESRFQLLISNTPIAKEYFVIDDLFSLDNTNGTIKVKMNLKNGEVGDIKVASLTGQILDTHFVTNKDVVEITGIKSTGLYIISFYTSNGIFSKKVIIKN